MVDESKNPIFRYLGIGVYLLIFGKKYFSSTLTLLDNRIIIQSSHKPFLILRNCVPKGGFLPYHLLNTKIVESRVSCLSFAIHIGMSRGETKVKGMKGE